MTRGLVSFRASAYHGPVGRFRECHSPRANTWSRTPVAIFGRPTFFELDDRKGLARSLPVGKLKPGPKNPSLSAPLAPGNLRQYSFAAGCGRECNRGAVLRHGCEPNTAAAQETVLSARRSSISISGSKKPVLLEAPVAHLSARGGVSLPRLSRPRLSFFDRCLHWEFPCGHTAPVQMPAPAGPVANAASSASCPTCASLEALVARRRPVSEVAHV